MAGVGAGLVKTMKVNDFDCAIQEAACALAAMVARHGVCSCGCHVWVYDASCCFSRSRSLQRRALRRSSRMAWCRRW